MATVCKRNSDLLGSLSVAMEGGEAIRPHHLQGPLPSSSSPSFSMNIGVVSTVVAIPAAPTEKLWNASPMIIRQY